jgi:hypothetical protein
MGRVEPETAAPGGRGPADLLQRDDVDELAVAQAHQAGRFGLLDVEQRLGVLAYAVGAARSPVLVRSSRSVVVFQVSVSRWSDSVSKRL